MHVQHDANPGHVSHCIVHVCWLCSSLAMLMYAWHLAEAPYAASLLEKKRKEKTTPFGVNLMRSQVLYRAAQSQPATAREAHTPG